jgi:8-oxo-dGTP diphosphatase
MGANDFWAPPGGGVEFGQGMEEALFREFNEETGLIIMVERFRFITEFIERPLHAIEVFFDTKVIGGELKTGADPEMDRKKQIIEQAEFKEWKSILAIPNAEKHGIFRLCAKPKQLKSIAGFHRI